MNHVVRGITLEPTIGPRHWYYVEPFFFFPARPFPAITLSNGWRLGISRAWDTTTEAAVQVLIDLIEAEAIPFLDRCATVDGALQIIDGASEKLDRHYEELAYGYALAGRYDRSLAAIEEMLALSEGPRPAWVAEMRQNAARLKSAVALGKVEVDRLLAENERWSLEKCDLTKQLGD